MTEIQTHSFHPMLQPALLLGAAYFAGSERFIQYFPETSRGGLLLKAVWGSTALYASETWAHKQETPLEGSLRLTAAFACGAFVASYAAKPLKGRVQLSPEGACRFTLLEGSIKTGLILVANAMPVSSHLDPKQTPPINLEDLPQDVKQEAGSPKPSRAPVKPPPQKTINEMVQEWHTHFTWNPQAWDNLSEEDRTDYAQKFYEADLPCLSLKGLPLDLDAFVPKNVGEIAPHQKAWRQEINRHNFPLSAPLVAEEYPDKENIPPEVLEKYERFEACLKEWQTLPRKELDKWILKFYNADLPPLSLEGRDLDFPYFFEFPSNVDLTQNQLFWISEALLQSSISKDTFDSEDSEHEDFSPISSPLSPYKDPTFSLEASLQKQDPKNILELSKEDLKPLFETMTPSLFKKLRYYYQIAYNTAFFNQGFKPFYMWRLTDDHCTAIIAYDSLNWVHAQFQTVPAAFDKLDPSVREQLSRYFKWKNLEEISDSETVLKSLSSLEVLQWSKEEARYWKDYLKKHPNQWKGFDDRKVAALQKRFLKTSPQTPKQHLPLSPIKQKPSASKKIFLKTSPPNKKQRSPFSPTKRKSPVDENTSPISPTKRKRPPMGCAPRLPLSPIRV